jgi:hypothetical protein
MDEESASQSSGAGFNDNLSKKSRIEEIRANIMKNIGNFYALKWIRIIFLFMIFITAAFSGCYLIIYSTMHNTITDLSDLNIGYFQTTIWLGNLVSSLISMRTVFKFQLNNENIQYNSYITNIDDYFNQLRTFSDIWYQNILLQMGGIEQKMSIYYRDNTDQPLWSNLDITYPQLSTIQDKESFPLGISQTLSASNKLLQSDIFSPKYIRSSNYSDDEIDRINYASFINIENTISNIIPYQIKTLNKITTQFQDFNSANIIYVLIIIISYGIVMILLSIFYLIFLYFTNKNMQEGFEKASHMKLDKIEETIKKIETFNEKCLMKFRMKELRASDDTRESKNDLSNAYQNQSTANTTLNDKYKTFGTEPKRFKNLNILSYSYFQVLFLIIIIGSVLIPLYFTSYTMIVNFNKLLAIQTYALGRLVVATHSMVNIKCEMSDCKVDNLIATDSYEFFALNRIEDIVRNIGLFPTLSDFYNNKFLQNACLVIYNKTDANYTTCFDDVIIESANNTDSLLKLLEETVAIIEKDKKMKTGNKYLSKNGTELMFSNKYLFESEYFNELETVFYKYLYPVSDSFSWIFKDSLQAFLDSKRITIIILVVVFVIVILIFAMYVIVLFINKLIHLLSVSRCILKIIPTNVITNTNELESWLESKY